MKGKNRGLLVLMLMMQVYMFFCVLIFAGAQYPLSSACFSYSNEIFFFFCGIIDSYQW